MTVLGLPRGGVPVAFEVARGLGVALDVFVVRKLGVPGHEELAFGAIAGGVRVLNDDVVRRYAIGPDLIESVATAEGEELRRRERTYRGDRPPFDPTGRTVILIDDGLATGATMRAALAAIHEAGPAAVVVAVPVAARDTIARTAPLVDRFVCVLSPEDFHAVGHWYDDFSPTTDEEVRELLDRAGQAE